MKRLIVLSTVALLTACSSVKPRLPDEVVINGVSKHFFEDGKNGQNYGAGVRYGKVGAGVFRNSRVFESYSVYLNKEVWSKGRFSARLGGMIYDNRRNYDLKLLPQAAVGYRVGPIELGLMAGNKDVIGVGRLVWSLK